MAKNNDLELQPPPTGQAILLKPESRPIIRKYGMIHVDLLEQVTEEFDDPNFADSVNEFNVLQPITIERRDQAPHRIVGGRRRVKAARLCGIDEVPFVEFDSIEGTIAEVAVLVMNDHRTANVIAEIRALERLHEELKISVTSIADACRVPRTTIEKKLHLLNLVPELRNALESGLMSASVAVKVCKYSPEEQAQLVAIIRDKGKLTWVDVAAMRKAGATGTLTGLEFPTEEREITEGQAAIIDLFEALEKARGESGGLSDKVTRWYRNLVMFAKGMGEEGELSPATFAEIDEAVNKFSRLVVGEEPAE